MRRTIAISTSVVFVLVLSFGSLLSVSYYRRWQASRLLEVVRQLHPGTTTEVQSRALLKPFAEYEVISDQQHAARDLVQYDFIHSARLHPLRFTLPWTLFTVNIEFIDGLVARMDVTEMQEDHPGYPHSNSVSVSIYSNRLCPLPADFNGYSEHSRSTGEIDSKGNWTGFECCHARFIKLDERATPAQLSRSLNFRLSCMTSFVRCKDDRQILP
jgi:hypothetical protein